MPRDQFTRSVSPFVSVEVTATPVSSDEKRTCSYNEGLPPQTCRRTAVWRVHRGDEQFLCCENDDHLEGASNTVGSRFVNSLLDANPL
jgi:hypothetical protein